MNDREMVMMAATSIGRRREAEFYLNQFQESDGRLFAAIVLDPLASVEMAESLAAALRFLARISLSPLLITGYPDAAAGVEGVAAVRRALEDTLPISEPRSLDELACEAGVADVSGRPATPVIHMPLERLATPESRASWLAELLDALSIRRVILLHYAGCLQRDGVGVDVLTFGEEAACLLESGGLDSLQQLYLQSAELIQGHVAADTQVSVASPINLLEELFTTKGKGTLLRRKADITSHSGFGTLDIARLNELMEVVFGHPIPPDFDTRPVSRIYLAADYRGAAVLSPCPVGDYLSKFVVHPSWQGAGLGRDLWRRLRAEHPRLLWRSNPARPVNDWYMKACDGMTRVGGWSIYWCGLACDEIPDAVRFATSLLPDFPR